jgi:hypothetical protein
VIIGWCVSRRNRGRERGAEEGKRRSPVGGGGLVRDQWAVWCVTATHHCHQRGVSEARKGRSPVAVWCVTCVSRRVETEEGRGERKRRSVTIHFFFGIREIKTEELEGLGRMKSLIILQRVKGLMNFSGLRGCQGPGPESALEFNC